MTKCYVCGKDSPDLWTFDGNRHAHAECEIGYLLRKMTVTAENIAKGLAPLTVAVVESGNNDA